MTGVGARRVAAAALLGGVIFTVGCDDKKKSPPLPPEPSASPAGVASTLGIDAAALGEPVDPPPPAGDLRAEIDHFVNVDACVNERAKLDPLVGDALRAIGYDTFLRDACRMLEAAKDKKRETCDRVDSSALRARCQNWVAIAEQTPDACAMQVEGVPSRGRNPSCVAIAGKDPRLCAAEPRSTDRATCDAIVNRDEARCDALLPHERAACKREVARLRTMTAPPLSGLPNLPASRGKLSIHGEGGTPDPQAHDVDLATDLARGVVAVAFRDRASVELGSLGESEAVRIAPSPNRRPRVGLAVLFEPGSPGSKEPAAPKLERLEIDVPGEATLVVPSARCDCKITAAKLDRARGGELSLALEGTVALGARSYRIGVELATFVRDVVADRPDARTLPPVHPRLGIGSGDTRAPLTGDAGSAASPPGSHGLGN